jgi:hypothetical protein
MELPLRYGLNPHQRPARVLRGCGVSTARPQRSARIRQRAGRADGVAVGARAARRLRPAGGRVVQACHSGRRGARPAAARRPRGGLAGAGRVPVAAGMRLRARSRSRPHGLLRRLRRAQRSGGRVRGRPAGARGVGRGRRPRLCARGAGTASGQEGRRLPRRGGRSGMGACAGGAPRGVRGHAAAAAQRLRRHAGRAGHGAARAAGARGARLSPLLRRAASTPRSRCHPNSPAPPRRPGRQRPGRSAWRGDRAGAWSGRRTRRRRTGCAS